MKCPMTALRENCTPECKWYDEVLMEDEEGTESHAAVCAMEKIAEGVIGFDSFARMMATAMAATESKGTIQ